MKRFLKNSKALSPLVATLLLLAFALVIGTATMGWGKAYVDNIEKPTDFEPSKSAVVINIEDIDTPLKELQIKYITGQISEEEYLTKEKQIVNS